MNKEQEALYELSSDLWYTLHEDNEKDATREYLVKYLKIESKFLQSFNVEQRESRGIYKNIPIKHDGATGPNVAFSILSVISLNNEWINETDEPVLIKIFWLISGVFTHPLATNDWNKLLKSIDKL